MFRFSVGQAYLWRDTAALQPSSTLGLPGTGRPSSRPSAASASGSAIWTGPSILTHFHEDHAGSAAAIAAAGGAACWRTAGTPRSSAATCRPRRRPHARGTPPARAHRRRCRRPAARPALPCRPGTQRGRSARSGRRGSRDRCARPYRRQHRHPLPGPPRAVHRGQRGPYAGRAGNPGAVQRGPRRGDWLVPQLAELDVDVACFGHGEPVLADGSAALRHATSRT